ncbi:uracil-DNA glycosylase [Rhodoblastus sphagnicola]|uniref:Uracil-DNA glycosylase n=1 Tax=Rhodoblastus sphagnicola TaxID=333368 RepID=A0A2S6NBP6_9HYPH|nr:uracil-DNA glycosylase family protein [Rhodoblastus sphagnicola]MBB4199674.1 uracil-DNA glycosylase [Rhodoblastus sphagnicola]PPQ32014.1 uracil-DNA glycosylase [Rhodoblastus sphagnicola]
MDECAAQPTSPAAADQLAALVERIGACRICVEHPIGAPLPHAPRPVVRVSGTARLLIAGQAPGARVHASGLPFDDPSGDRLRDWLGLDRERFYDVSRVAVAAMGFCFPGYDARGADRPPRPECRARWHDALFALMPQVELVVAVGRAAQDFHARRLGRAYDRKALMAECVRHFAAGREAAPRLIVLPHPSWRNTGWLRRNPWFEAEVLPELKRSVEKVIKFTA